MRSTKHQYNISRVYDFGRVGKDGKPRELHIQKAIDVSNLSPIESDFKPCGPEERMGIVILYV